MIKIHYDHQIFTLQQYGGISRYIYELSRRVNDADGMAARIVAPMHINKYIDQGDAPVFGRKFSLPVPTRRAFDILNRMVSNGFQRLAPADILHMTYYGESGIKNHRAKVLTVHDMIHELFPAAFKANDPTSRMKRKAVAAADRIICVSENTRQDLIKLFNVCTTKVVTVHHGFNVKNVDIRDLSMDSVVGKPYFLYVGRRDKYKNFEAFVKAFGSSSLLRRESRILAFGGDGFDATEVASMNRYSLQVGKDVVFQSGGDEKLAGAYSGALALVYPSIYEGFGIPPLEAMNCSCPVLCSNTSSLPEVVGDAALMFDPLNIESLRTAMEELLLSESKRSALVEAGQVQLKKFSWDRCASETTALYRQLA